MKKQTTKVQVRKFNSEKVWVGGFFSGHYEETSVEDVVNKFLSTLDPEDILAVQYSKTPEEESYIVTYKNNFYNENSLDKDYLNLLSDILTNGRVKSSGRANMPSTTSLVGTRIVHNLKDGFPLLTTKKMHFKGIFHELIWILNGDTNIKYLVDNGVNIWNKNGYDWYLKACKRTNQDPVTLEDFVEIIRRCGSEELINLSHTHFPQDSYCFGDLGRVYGYQWRKGKDQLKTAYEGLKNNPYSRYHVISGWDLGDMGAAALGPCHLLYHFNSVPLTNEEREAIGMKRGAPSFEIYSSLIGDSEAKACYYSKLEAEFRVPKDRLDLVMYQRSVDTVLGLPYNLASMGLFLTIMAEATGKDLGNIVWMGGDTHIYNPHKSSIQEQLEREPFPLPKLRILKKLNTFEDILSLKFEDIVLEDYVSHPKLKDQPELFA